MRRESVNTKVHIGIYECFAPNLGYGTLLTYTTHNFDGYIIKKTSNFCGLLSKISLDSSHELVGEELAVDCAAQGSS